MNNSIPGSRSWSEARTGDGRVIGFTFAGSHPEGIAKVIAGLYDVGFPDSHQANVSHGCYGRYSRFQITQHEYAGGNDEGGGGYVEILEIRNAPDCRCGVVMYEWVVSGGFVRSFFIEWKSVEDAKAFWKGNWCGSTKKERVPKAKGFIRIVECGLLQPWFYATGDQELVGDYAFPDGIQEDPVFRFGVKCLVPTNNGFDKEMDFTIKTCMGCRVFVEEPDRNSDSPRKDNRLVRMIIWDDGTLFDSRWRESSSPQPRPLRADELWADEAVTQFQRILSGKKIDFRIMFPDGSRFVGKFVPGATGKQDPEGSYMVEVSFKGTNEVRKGNVDFVPTPEFPTVVSRVMAKLDTKGRTIAKVKVTSKETKPGGKKWSGVFFTK